MLFKFRKPLEDLSGARPTADRLRPGGPRRARVGIAAHARAHAHTQSENTHMQVLSAWPPLLRHAEAAAGFAHSQARAPFDTGTAHSNHSVDSFMPYR